MSPTHATTYDIPTPVQPPDAPAKTVYLTTSGDLRESANTAAWPLQLELESIVSEQLRQAGWDVVRAFEPTDHGFVRSQRMGLEVFKQIPRDAPLVVAIANWQYSHHVLAGPRSHRRPILTVATLAPDWPRLVG